MKTIGATTKKDIFPVITKILKKQESPGKTIALHFENKKIQNALIKAIISAKDPSISICRSYMEYLKNESKPTTPTEVNLSVLVYPSEWQEWNKLVNKLRKNNKQIVYMIDNSIRANSWADKIQCVNKEGTKLVPMHFCFD